MDKHSNNPRRYTHKASAGDWIEAHKEPAIALRQAAELEQTRVAVSRLKAKNKLLKPMRYIASWLNRLRRR